MKNFFSFLLALILVCGVSLNANAADKVPLGAGSGIVLPVEGKIAAVGLCTLGAIGKDNYGRMIGITAGHCGDVGDEVKAENFRSHGTIGKFIKSDKILDYGIIMFYPAKVFPVKTVENITVNSIDRKLPDFLDPVCKIGRTTHHTCGVVLDSDKETHTSTICVLAGDSGAPVIQRDKLVGIVTAYISPFPIGCFPAPETGTNIGIILDKWGKGFTLY